MLLDCSLKHAFGEWHSAGLCFKGMLLVERGDRAGLAILRTALHGLRETSFTDNLLEALCAFAQGLAAVGQLGEALAAIDEALERSKQHDECWCRPELLRVRGEIILLNETAGLNDTAEDHFRQALDLACSQGALSWELRAATSLARLWREAGKAAEAHELLSGCLRPVH